MKPYPFIATLEANTVKKTVEALMLTKTGMIVLVGKHLLHVGEHYQIQFELPGMDASVLTQVRVMKTYDRVIPSPTGVAVERLAELIFDQLSPEHMQRITHFVKAVGQK